jgi:putative SOS response-associated peptidase YedK
MFPGHGMMANKRRICYAVAMDEGRKRAIGIMAPILASLHMQTKNQMSCLVDPREVILDPDSYDIWLDPGMRDVTTVSELLKPYDAQLMR